MEGETQSMLELLDKLKSGDASVVVVGLGYVGLPLAVRFAQFFHTVGFDVSESKVKRLLSGVDDTGEVDPGLLSLPKLEITSRASDLSRGEILVVAVPTPVDKGKKPDLSPVLKACELIGTRMRKGAVIIFESTVYPGVTEELCGPALERASGMVCGRDFFLGYSPERVNPGDQQHTIERIVKVTSGQTPEVAELVAQLYETIIVAGVHRAPSIRTAEAAKVIENTQRDLNIALMNELAVIFERLGLDTRSVLEAASTKWNFLPFVPGLVGGHCIGVDPYYLTYIAEQCGYVPQVILAGRRINDSMGKYVADQTLKQMARMGKRLNTSPRILVLGLTFKENVPDLRNSKVVDIIHELRSLGLEVQVHDPLVTSQDARAEYGFDLCELEETDTFDVLVLAVSHDAYRRMGLQGLRALCGEAPLLMDVKAMFHPEEAKEAGFTHWRL